MNLRCWWFGCDPDLEKPVDEPIPCLRCGAHDVTYDVLVGDTRHNRAKDFLRYWLLRKWFPERCPCCKKRYGDHPKCLPF